ncbi:MAG: response regulator [Myxococcota bacterium]|nr:response regulator [Myxococcota bacterium]
MVDERGDGDGQLAAARARIAALETELAKAHEHRQMLESILRYAPDFLCQTAPDGRFLYINRFDPGMDPDVVMAGSIFDYTAPTDHARIRATLARVLETRTAQSYETLGEGPDRAVTPYFTRIAPVLDDRSEVRSLVAVATDISRVKEAEAALAESEAMLLHVLETTGLATWWFDPVRGTGGHDAAQARLLGLDPADLSHDRRDTVMAHVHADDRDNVRRALEVAQQSGVYGPIVHRIVRPDGSLRWVQASARLLQHRTGPRLVGGMLDITDRKRLEEHFAQSRKMESIGRLAGGIAHDFNNMLTAILSYNHFALAAAPPGSRLAGDLGEVRRAAERSVTLTSQLLSFARQQVIAPTLTALDSVLENVLGLLRRVLGEDIEVTTVLRARGHVRIDVSQFEQVLVNLATNARDAMTTGGRLTIETADVELDAAYAASHPEVTPGPHVLLSVSDTGVGIAADVLLRVFEPFFTTKELGRGTGLGLATCYGIVTQSGGSITVESAPAAGTTFRVYLPRAEGELATPEPVVAAAPARGSETVLLVEDEPIVRTVAISVLERAGFRVLAAGDGVQALALARAHVGRIELLVTDVVMPHMGGPQLAATLVQERPQLAVLFVSGYTDDEVLRHGVQGGEIDFLQKPFSPATLTQRVRQALDRRRR